MKFVLPIFLTGPLTKLVLEAPLVLADALARGQVESGGWDYLIDFDPEKMRLSYLLSDAGKSIG